jgi:hypothetical protein
VAQNSSLLSSIAGYLPWGIALVLAGVGIGFGRDKLNQRSTEKTLDKAWGGLETCLIGPSAYDRAPEETPREIFRRIALNPESRSFDASPRGWPQRCRARGENVLVTLRGLPRTAERDALRSALEDARPHYEGLGLYDRMDNLVGSARSLGLLAGWGHGDAAPQPFSQSEPTPIPGSLRFPRERFSRSWTRFLIEGEFPRACQTIENGPYFECVDARAAFAAGRIDEIYDAGQAYAPFLFGQVDGVNHRVFDLKGRPVFDGPIREREVVFGPSYTPDVTARIDSIPPKSNDRSDYQIVRRIGEKQTVLRTSLLKKAEALPANSAADLSPLFLDDVVLWPTKKGWMGQTVEDPFGPKASLVLPFSNKAPVSISPIASMCERDGSVFLLGGGDAAPVLIIKNVGFGTVEVPSIPLSRASAMSLNVACRAERVDVTWLEDGPAARYRTVTPHRVLCDYRQCKVSSGDAVQLFGLSPDDPRDTAIMGMNDGKVGLIWRTPLLGIRARFGAITQLDSAREWVVTSNITTAMHAFGSGDNVNVLYSGAFGTAGAQLAPSGLNVALTAVESSLKFDL